MIFKTGNATAVLAGASTLPWSSGTRDEDVHRLYCRFGVTRRARTPNCRTVAAGFRRIFHRRALLYAATYGRSTLSHILDKHEDLELRRFLKRLPRIEYTGDVISSTFLRPPTDPRSCTSATFLRSWGHRETPLHAEKKFIRVNENLLGTKIFFSVGSII